MRSYSRLVDDHGPAGEHRRPDLTNGLGAGQPVVARVDPDDGTWFEALGSPPVDTPLIVLIPRG